MPPDASDPRPRTLDIPTLRRLGPDARITTIAQCLLDSLGTELTPELTAAARAFGDSVWQPADDRELERRAQTELAYRRIAAAADGVAEWLPDLPMRPERDDLDAWSTFAANAGRRVSRSPSRFMKHDRLDRAERERVGLGALSRGEYKQAFHAVRSLRSAIDATKALRTPAPTRDRMSWEGLLTRLAHDAFLADPLTAFLILVHLRTVQPSGSVNPNGYEDPLDAHVGAEERRARVRALYDALWSACEARPQETSWWALAHVLPTKRVLTHLSPGDREAILRMYETALGEEARALRAFWTQHDVDAGAMVFERGVDAAAWNRMADRFERARCGYVQAMVACGREVDLESRYPARVPRMRARMSPGPSGEVYKHQIHRDAKAWARLPRPWEVVLGGAACSPRDIVSACAAVGVDAAARGWIVAR